MLCVGLFARDFVLFDMGVHSFGGRDDELVDCTLRVYFLLVFFFKNRVIF